MGIVWGGCWDYLQLIDLIDLVGLWLRGFEFPAGVVGLVFWFLCLICCMIFLDFGVFWFACWVVCVYVCASERCVLCLCLVRVGFTYSPVGCGLRVVFGCLKFWV